MGYNYKKVMENHREILRMKALGAHNVDIAEKLGITPVTVCSVVNSPLHKQVISTLQAGADSEVMAISERITSLAPKALDIMEAIITKGHVFDKELKPNDIKNTAVDILSMAGHGKVTKISGNINHHLTAEQIKEINQRAEELRNSDTLEVEAQVS